MNQIQGLEHVYIQIHLCSVYRARRFLCLKANMLQSRGLDDGIPQMAYLSAHVTPKNTHALTD